MRVDQMGVNPYDGLYVCGHAHVDMGCACMSVISCVQEVDKLESHDLPRTGSAKWRMLSAMLAMFPPSSLQMRLLHDGSLSLPPPCIQVVTTA